MENINQMTKKRRCDESFEEDFISKENFEDSPELFKKHQLLKDLEDRKNYYKRCSMKQTTRINKMAWQMNENEAEIDHLKKLLDEKNLELVKLNDEFNQKSKGMIEEYIGHWQEREKELEEDLKRSKGESQECIDLKYQLEDMRQRNGTLMLQVEDLTKKLKISDQYIKTVDDKEKKYMAEVHLLRANQDSLTTKNKELTEEIEMKQMEANLLSLRNKELKNCKQTINELNEEIKRLILKRIDERKVEQMRGKVEQKYKQMYEKAKEQLCCMDKEIFEREKIIIDKQKAIVALNSEIHTLKNQKKYYEAQNDHHKRKLLGAVHTLVKSRDVYANSIGKISKDGMDVTEEFAQKIVEVVLQFKDQARNEYLTQLSNTVTENMEKLKQIDISEKIIVGKMGDERVNCGSCDKSFAKTSNLKTHMTVTHKINYNTRSVRIIQID